MCITLIRYLIRNYKLFCVLVLFIAGLSVSEAEEENVATYSIVAFDPMNGDLGVAVQSKFLGVGPVVPWIKTGVGVIATQAWANTQFGPDGLTLLEESYYKIGEVEESIEILQHALTIFPDDRQIMNRLKEMRAD